MISSDALGSVPNVLSIDFESWVHAYRPADTNSPARRRLDNGFVLSAGMKLLDLLDRYNAVATFFVVSEIFEWYPELLEKIERRGHEIALHSYSHRILWSKSDLADEIGRSAEFMQRFKVRGFRAPRGFMKEEHLDILRRFEIVYDSSSYGAWEAIRRTNGVAEIPMSAWAYSNSERTEPHFGPLNWKLIGQVFPFGSPYVIGLIGPLLLRCVRFENRRKRPAIICFHLWQVVHPCRSHGFMRQLLAHEILSLPYCIKRHRLFIELLKTVKTMTMGQFFDARFHNTD